MFMVLSSWQSHCESSPGSFELIFKISHEFGLIFEIKPNVWSKTYTIQQIQIKFTLRQGS